MYTKTKIIGPDGLAIWVVWFAYDLWLGPEIFDKEVAADIFTDIVWLFNLDKE